MTVLLQISDPHFGTEQAPVMQALEQLVRAQQPELVVLSGDITQRATRAQFRAARAFVDRLGAPAVLAIPGNHDIPLFAARHACCWTRTAATAKPSVRELEPVFESAHCWSSGSNTTALVPARGRRGVGGADRARGGAARGPRPSQLRVVVVHQPLAVTLPRMRRTACTGAMPRCGAGPRPGRIWCSAGTSTCPSCGRHEASAVARAPLGGAGRHGGVVAGAARGAELREVRALRARVRVRATSGDRALGLDARGRTLRMRASPRARAHGPPPTVRRLCCGALGRITRHSRRSGCFR